MGADFAVISGRGHEARWGGVRQPGVPGQQRRRRRGRHRRLADPHPPGVRRVLHRDSVGATEQKYPVLIESIRLVVDGGGAGRRRGAPPSRSSTVRATRPCRRHSPATGS
ncbi:hypothetical protein HBB16_00110 [Pseudonocardia sp. MCCB 268]|nr:hypothetical protein [Pseudonocardia cytotoxica]